MAFEWLFIVLSCQEVEWVDFFLSPVFQNPVMKLHINHKGATQNSLKISEMSLMILSCMHVLCRQAHLVKKELSRYNDPHILRMGSKSL